MIFRHKTGLLFTSEGKVKPDNSLFNSKRLRNGVLRKTEFYSSVIRGNVAINPRITALPNPGYTYLSQ
ncbi:Uncharacterised protein [Legionella cincinnatiensis]|uniref:Uncharacterized protein n=1 Tax=Legionella cincinnatiensis TaxID=28085 RepID=A0A378INL5_9GAMM|nr:hypothetical protein Lcin_1328 [Legionella cincinnatiensis]STX36061.1 Uncharacterised protein [Legionella cincinnatiensis]